LPWPYNKALLARVFSEHPLFVGPIKVELHSIIILWRWWFRAFWGQTLLLNIVELLFEEVHQGVVQVDCRVVWDKLILLMRHDPRVLDELLDAWSFRWVLIKHKLDKG
jgi:hypothetical protein